MKSPKKKFLEKELKSHCFHIIKGIQCSVSVLVDVLCTQGWKRGWFHPFVQKTSTNTENSHNIPIIWPQDGQISGNQWYGKECRTMWTICLISRNLEKVFSLELTPPAVYALITLEIKVRQFKLCFYSKHYSKTYPLVHRLLLVPGIWNCVPWPHCNTFHLPFSPIL